MIINIYVYTFLFVFIIDQTTKISRCKQSFYNTVRVSLASVEVVTVNVKEAWPMSHQDLLNFLGGINNAFAIKTSNALETDGCHRN